MKHVVVGAGEVGIAISEVLEAKHDVWLRDVKPTGPDKADVLHICIPYNHEFEDVVKAYKASYEADLVIIHSTVAVGTTEYLGDDYVHSPVRGKHPRLAESVRTFVKFFGGARAQQAADYFSACGVEVAIRRLACDTEAGKLWELAQYGLNILIEKQIYKWCATRGLDFDTVYTDFAVTYNAGYKDLGDAQFIRPILRHVPGPIGGHCVVQGSLLIGDPLADLVSQAGVSDLISVK